MELMAMEKYATYRVFKHKTTGEVKRVALEEIDDTASSEATMTVAESETLQNVIKGIYESNINYDGSDISAEHRSHDADQIFFDNTDVADIVIADDVQDAIEDVANATACAVIVNDSGIDCDFRVEGDSETHLLFVLP